MAKGIGGTYREPERGTIGRVEKIVPLPTGPVGLLSDVVGLVPE